MTAYIVAIRNKITDPAEMETYKSLAPLAAAKFPNKNNLASYGKCEALEGPPVQGVVLIEFPTYEEAKAWYDSPEYQKAKSHRIRGSDYQFILFEGK